MFHGRCSFIALVTKVAHVELQSVSQQETEQATTMLPGRRSFNVPVTKAAHLELQWPSQQETEKRIHIFIFS